MEYTVNALSTGSPDEWRVLTLAALHGIAFAVLIFSGAVKVSKRLRRNREPIEWARCEVILVSCFLNAWHSWATSSHFASTFSDADELDVAFRKFTTEMVMNGSLTKHYNTDRLMRELFVHDGRDPKHPFGLDGQSKALNERRRAFAREYADSLRRHYISLI